MTIDAQEKISVHRRLDLPGVELKSSRNSARLWRHFCTGFELLFPETWEGDVVYRQAQHRLSPGTALCAEPGHAFRVLHVARAGTMHVLSVDIEACAGLLEPPRPRESPAPGPVILLTRALAATSARLLDYLRDASGPLERLRELLAHVLGELVPEHGTRAHDTIVIRDLRSFKRHYGLTPHAYDLCKRIALAREALRSGARPSDVAHQYGFVDQSHLTRHFKRLVGVTPYQYSRAGKAPPTGRAPEPGEA